MTSEYLLEIRFLEMPSRYLAKTSRQLSVRLFEDLMGRGLGPEEMITGSTPRRLMVCLRGLPEVEPEREKRLLGPPVAEAFDTDGEPTSAALDFATSAGVAIADLVELKTERGAHLGWVERLPGLPLFEVLQRLVASVAGELEWWPATSASRPTGVLSMLDGELLPCEVLGVEAGLETAGHPILSPELIEVESFDHYRAQLRELGLEVEVAPRREALERSLQRIAEEQEGELAGGAALLEELTAGCEIPGVVQGDFDDAYLELPEEILLAALGGPSKAFGLRGKDGLLARFVTVMDRADDPSGYVRAGQERRIAGCLADARFRYENDRRLPLAERSRMLTELDFHPRLGSFAAKAERVRSLVELACRELGWEDALEPAQQAAGLLKVDLTTGMVRDYPELRGTVGGLYAREEGYVEEVWRTVYEHYQRRPIPTQQVGRLVAAVDRLDSLVGLLGVDQLPSGSRDPLGLRRLAQGLLRILIDAEMELDLDLMSARAVLLYEDGLNRSAEILVGELQSFLAERSRHLLGRRGFAQDEIDAAAAVGGGSLPDLVARLRALQAFREEPDFRSLVLAAKRIFNMVQDFPELELSTEELTGGAERDLAEALHEVRRAVDLAADERRYEDCLRAMVELVPHLDRFFSEVLVMDENESLRDNRIALLQTCRRLFWRIARLREMRIESVG